ncbi:hypothetical protein M404DRAFT_34761 [Pisolithus tinctorius Marx 270]|uniref:Uncharacterized protein n=1 Tax=Pisolithus tinctorius Marx 270 TaxID=870435 RepID=A0A0C3JAL8_PISTI|nr:hypothetical protein M404DRAFT_34761 [Pisolithus tinctorius Marx 270]
MYSYEPKPLLSLIVETHLPATKSRLEELRKAREEALAAHDLARRTMKDHSSRPFTPFQKVGTVYHEVNKDSPLDLVYHATIQALWLEELSRYVNRQNPLLSPACTILNEITTQQVPLLLRLFDVLGGADLIYNVRQHPMLIAPPPPGS